MQTYHFQEGDMTLPLPAQDLTVTVLAFAPLDTLAAVLSPAATIPELSVVMTRQIVEASQQLDAFVEQQMDTLARTLKEYQFLRRTPLFLDEREAELTEFTWRADNGVVYQRQATLLCPASASLQPPSRVALTITATTLLTLQSKYEFTFQQLLYSLRLHR